MRQHRTGAALLAAAAALLLAPAVSPAQVTVGVGRFGVTVGTPYYGYYSPGYSGYYGYAPGYYGYSGYSTRYAWAPYYSPTIYSYGSWSYPTNTWQTYAYPAYSTTDYYTNNPTMTPGYYSLPAGASASYSYGALSSPAAARDAVRLNVRVPDPDAKVWVEGRLTQQRGTFREFISPPVNPNVNYVYDITARWTENGRQVERSRTVRVSPDATTTVDFTAPSPPARLDEIDRTRGATDVERERRATEIDRERRGTAVDREQRGTAAPPAPANANSPRDATPRAPANANPPGGTTSPNNDTRPPDKR